MPDTADAGTFEMEFVDCKCPHCRGALSFVGTQAGTVQQCPQCSGAVIVPAHGEPNAQLLPLPLATERLRLRALRDGDEEDLIEALHGAEAVSEDDRNDTKDMVERAKVIRLGQPGQALTLGFELVQTGRLIGWVWLAFTDADNRQMEFGETLGKAFGEYSVEAIRGVLGFCFQGLTLHRVISRTPVTTTDNAHEAAVARREQAGMRCEGEFLKNEKIRGEWINTVWHAMLDEQFKA